jgi:hypothetical protein
MYNDIDPRDLPLATLRLFADDLLPEDIERIMEIKADHSAAKGEGMLHRGEGGRISARTGTWFITTENKKVGWEPEAHLSWVVQLLQTHLTQLRTLIPHIQADLSLLVHDRNFEISKLPEKLLKNAVSIGDLEIEIPERGVDVVLTPQNISSYTK